MTVPVRPPHEDVLARAIAALPAVPTPPAVSEVRAALAGAGTASAGRVRRRAALAWAAALLALRGAGSWYVAQAPAPRRAGPVEAPVAGGGAGARLGAEPDADVVAWRGPVAVALGSAREGDRIEARRRSRVRLDGHVGVDLETGATLVLGGPREVTLERGRAAFDVAHDPRAPLRVLTDRVTVTDVGTRFALDRDDVDGRERVLVTVEEGRVDANGLSLLAGHGVAFLQGAATGSPWPLDARPTVALEPEDVSPASGGPVVLRVVLANPTDGWIPLPERDGLRAPLVVEVTDPTGATSPVRVTSSMLAPGTPAAGAIPPRGRAVFRVRFDRTFGSPGTYRLRAIFRPSGAVERPSSPEVSLTVR